MQRVYKVFFYMCYYNICCARACKLFYFFPAPFLKLSHVVSNSSSFFLKPANIIPSLLPFLLSFLLVPSPTYLLHCAPFALLFRIHFLCQSTFFFVLFPFPLSPFSPSPIPPPTEKSLVSPFLHSISTVLPVLLFSSILLLLLSLPFFLLSRWFLVSSPFFIPSPLYPLYCYFLLSHFYFFPFPFFFFRDGS
jgi:hypothetical protein